MCVCVTWLLHPTFFKFEQSQSRNFKNLYPSMWDAVTTGQWGI